MIILKRLLIQINYPTYSISCFLMSGYLLVDSESLENRSNHLQTFFIVNVASPYGAYNRLTASKKLKFHTFCFYKDRLMLSSNIHYIMICIHIFFSVFRMSAGNTSLRYLMNCYIKFYYLKRVSLKYFK